jgi:hypothetical protein
MVGNADQGFVGRHLRQGVGVNPVDFHKTESGLYCCPFVAVKIGLALRDVKGIGGGDFVEIAVAVVVDIQGLSDCGFQPVFAADAVASSVSFDLVAVDRVDLIAREKNRLLFQAQPSDVAIERDGETARRGSC